MTSKATKFIDRFIEDLDSKKDEIFSLIDEKVACKIDKLAIKSLDDAAQAIDDVIAYLELARGA